MSIGIKAFIILLSLLGFTLSILLTGCFIKEKMFFWMFVTIFTLLLSAFGLLKGLED